MANPYRKSWRPHQGYYPSQSVTGELADTVYQGLNMISKGGNEFKFYEQWTGYGLFATAGSNGLLSGTVAMSSATNVNTVTGTSTKFLSEVVPGQPIAISGRVYVPLRIDSNTSMVVTPTAHATVSGITAAMLQQIQELDTFIASFTRGSIINLPKGHMLGVGRGIVRRNGNVVPGTGWTLLDQPQIAVYDPGSATFSIYKLGMVTPTLTTLTPVVGGGTKMIAGNYCVRIVPAKTATDGYNNPSNPIVVTLATAGDRIQITFPAMDTANGQDAWRVYGTLSTSTASAVQGPWYYVRTLTTTDVASGGGTFTLEWSDAEISANDLLEFDNDAAPPAMFVGSIAGLPVLIGCNGPGRTLTGTAATTAGSGTITGTSTLFTTELGIDRLVYINNILYRVTSIASATSMTVTPVAAATASGLAIKSADEVPGPVIRPAKRTVGGYNLEAYPARAAVAVDPPEAILGVFQAKERIYLMTANSLAVAVPNPDTNTSNQIPVITLPFWKTGFRNPRAMAFANGYLYAYTTNGATRSAEFGDRVETEHEFAAPVATDMAMWDPGKVTVAYNARHEAICYLHADDGTRLGATSRYGTLLMYKLRTGTWDPPLRIEDLNDVNPTYAVSSATIQGEFYFASPTALGNTNIYQLEVPNGEVGEAYLASPFMDMGAEGFDKTVEGITAVAGRSSASNITALIYGSTPTGAVPITNLKAGDFSLSGPVTIAVDTPVVTCDRKKLNIRRLRTVAVRVRLGTSGSNGARLDEVILDGHISGVKY